MCRALAIGFLVFMTAGGPSHAAEAEVQAALDAFVEAFERGDKAAMLAAFADDAVTFPRAIMGPRSDETLDRDDYRRVPGIDPQMLALIDRLTRTAERPPYLDIEPRDVDIRVSGNMALATFHLVGTRSLGRRTFVLVKRDGAWKILHLHASNVVEPEPEPEH